MLYVNKDKSAIKILIIKIRVWKIPLEEEMATHSSILAEKITYRGAWWATVLRATKSWTQLSMSIYTK